MHSIESLKISLGSRYRALDPNLAKSRIRNPALQMHLIYEYGGRMCLQCTEPRIRFFGQNRNLIPDNKPIRVFLVRYNLGFSGSYFLNGDEWEDEGDEELVKQRDSFTWLALFTSHPLVVFRPIYQSALWGGSTKFFDFFSIRVSATKSFTRPRISGRYELPKDILSKGIKRVKLTVFPFYKRVSMHVAATVCFLVKLCGPTVPLPVIVNRFEQRRYTMKALSGHRDRKKITENKPWFWTGDGSVYTPPPPSK